MPVLGPDAFIHGITEVGCFFGQNRFGSLGCLVLGELPVLLNHLGIVHGDQGVLAFAAIEPDGREGRITSSEDVAP